MKTEVKTVTPKQASEWLEEDSSRIERGLFWNRPISEAHAQRLANQIELGLFMLTHQGIAFDTEGNLIDGRHRLRAVCIAKKAIKIMITTGVPKTNEFGLSTFDGIDRIKSRSVGHQLQSHGYGNGNLVAAIVNSTVAICSPTVKSISALECGQAIKIYDMIKKEYETVLDIISPNKDEGRSPILAPLIILARTHRDHVIDFAQKYVTLENIPRGHPLLTFKTWDKRHKGTLTGRENRLTLIRVVCSALRHHVEGNQPKHLYAAESAQQWLQGLDKNFCRRVLAIACPLAKMPPQNESLKLAA